MSDFPPSCRDLPIPPVSRNHAFCQGGIRHFLERDPGLFSCNCPAFPQEGVLPYTPMQDGLSWSGITCNFPCAKFCIFYMQDSCLSWRRNLTVHHAENLTFSQAKNPTFCMYNREFCLFSCRKHRDFFSGRRQLALHACYMLLPCIMQKSCIFSFSNHAPTVSSHDILKRHFSRILQLNIPFLPS